MDITIELIDSVVQVMYLFAICTVLLAKFRPKLQGFLKYGKTLGEDELIPNEVFLFDQLLLLQVPKFWFFHFYFLSLILSSTGFILVNMSFDYKLSHHILDTFREDDYGTIPIEVSRLTFFLMVSHSLRRFWETLFMMRYRKKSKMNISHYLAGIFFYTTINLQLFLNTDFRLEDIPQEETFDIKYLLSLVLFFVSSFNQYLHHLHLTKVIKYRIPTFGMFQYLCCAHYFDEILIYTSVFLLTENRTSFLALLWVIVNLSVSALETMKFYKSKETGKVQRWSIIPFIL